MTIDGENQKSKLQNKKRVQLKNRFLTSKFIEVFDEGMFYFYEM